MDKRQEQDVEELWFIEAERRYEEYKKGNIRVISVNEVLKEARNHLK